MEETYKKYEKIFIMKEAWKYYHMYPNMGFRAALKRAWYDAKLAVARFNVYGYRIRDDSETLIGTNMKDLEAQKCKDMNLYRYDNIRIKEI